MSGYMSRVLKPSKAEVSKQSIQNEIKAEKSLDKQAQNLIDKSGKFGEKQRNVQKEYEYKMSQFKKTYVHDWKVLKTNLTHLYPYEGLLFIVSSSLFYENQSSLRKPFKKSTFL